MNNLGQYKQMPPTFQKLQELQRDLEKAGYSLESLGLMLDTEDLSYYVTPCDVITFASTGQDGIHFGLLTDFGTVTDLEEAYVVYVSPSDFGEAVFLAARNLKEFTDILFTMKDTMEISNFFLLNEMNEKDHDEENENDDEDETEDIEYDEDEDEDDEYEDDYEDEEDEELLQERIYVLGKLKEALNCSIIKDIPAYYRRLFNERKEQTILHTHDGIGVIPVISHPNIMEKYELYEDMVIDIDDIRTYFQIAPTENKLAFVRDAQNLGIILDEKEVQEFIVEELQKLGLKIEAKRLLRSNENELSSHETVMMNHTFGYYDSE